MNALKRKVRVTGKKGSTVIEASFDLKVMGTYLRRNIADQIGEVSELSEPFIIKVGPSLRVVSVEHFMAVEIDIDETPLDWSCKVVDDLPYPLVIGSTFMSGRHIILDLINEDLLVEKPKLPDIIE